MPRYEAENGITPARGFSGGESAGGGSGFARAFSGLVNSLIESGLEARAAEVKRQAEIKGEEAAAASFAAGPGEAGQPIAPAGLREDRDTIAGASYNKAFLAAYLTRLDLGAEETARKIAAETPGDPAAFRTRFGAASEALVARMPPEYRENVRAALIQKGQAHLKPIEAKANHNALMEANHDLLRGMDEYSSQAATAWRQGDQKAASDADMKFRQTLAARSDLDPLQKEKLLLDYEENQRRHAVLG